jgi:phosphoenolpyruvate carboxykinase (GTP)
MTLNSSTALTQNETLKQWVSEMVALTRPDNVTWCDGSEEERKRLTDYAVAQGILSPLNEEKHPGSFLHRSNVNDVARVEHLTFICTPNKDDAGPTNNWMAPAEAYAKLRGLFEGSMKGRTMYLVPYAMGPLGSEHSKIGIEVTDSVYVALNMQIMTRMGKPALDMLGNSTNFNRGLHCTGDLNPDRRFICHFPQDNAIWSFGSGYGGNALLGKKCLALRIGSYLGRQEGWLAEHMLILGVESPEGQTSYVAAAFPSACGKTNFAMMIPPKRFDGWKVYTVGDDIAWLRVGEDGRLWAVNPENGYFGVAPGTNWQSNANAMKTIAKNTIFTNVALKPDNTVWWEGLDGEVPDTLTDWQGKPWKKGVSEGKAAHPNSRFTAPASNNPMLSTHVNDPRGVPISAIIFGGRRSNTIPLVMQSFNWSHGVYLGATLASETTAAATGQQGVVRRDPMAMLPFAGYNMADYFTHWLSMQKRVPYPPKIFMVNWFRKDKAGKFIWPGYGENMRVLKWIVDRAYGNVGAQETLFGWVPKQGHIDLSGLDIDPAMVDEATSIVESEWREELTSQKQFFDQFGDRMPKALELIRQTLLSRL